jgi:HK97 family phage major capsid protein
MTKRPAPTGAGRSASSHRRPGPEKKLCLTATFAESPGRACRTILATKSTGFEASEAADASPTLAQPSIPVYKASAFVPFSYEIGQDAVNFTQELGKLLSDGYDQLTATAYTTGTGSNQPTGIITALVASSPTVVVNTVGSNVLASGDIYALQNALPPRFQANAQWCASLTILNVLRQFETAAGALKFPGLQNNPPTLLGRSAHELSNMDPDFGKLRAGVWRLLEFHSCRSLPVPGRADPEPRGG